MKRKILLPFYAVLALVVSPALFFTYLFSDLFCININAFWGMIGLFLFPASIKAFCDTEKSTREDEKDTTNKQDNKEVNSQS